MPRSRRLRLLAPLSLVVLGLAACGSSDDPERADATLTQPPLTVRQQTTPRTTTVPTVTTPPATATQPAPPPATTPATPPDTGGAPATTPATAPDTGGAQAPPQDDPPGQRTPARRPSGGSATPVECGEAIGGFVKGISASGADCGAASGVVSSWYEAVNQGSAPDAAIEAAGYTCSGSMSGQRATVSCSGAGGARVSFTASP
jgi:hypothetical protein